MAKPKVDILVKIVNSSVIGIYCDDLSLASRDISTLKGITSILHLSSLHCLHASIDPRYDIQELRDEIDELLASDVPDVFKKEG